MTVFTLNAKYNSDNTDCSPFTTTTHIWIRNFASVEHILPGAGAWKKLPFCLSK